MNYIQGMKLEENQMSQFQCLLMSKLLIKNHFSEKREYNKIQFILKLVFYSIKK
jgi:hypothetical protein